MVTGDNRGSRRWWFILTVGSGLLAALLTIVTSLNVRWPVTIAVGSVVAAATAMLGELASRKLKPGPFLSTRERLEPSREHLRRLVRQRRVDGQDSLLDQMVQKHWAFDLDTQRVDVLHGKRGEPRLRLRGPTVKWSKIITKWDQARGRLVLLGEPGYGKTVAALTLLNQINDVDSPGKPVVELFPLVEWYRWRSSHPGENLCSWLAYQLALTHPELSAKTTRALVDHDLVVPLLDGLDEVPAAHRRLCKEAIDDYGRRSKPFRPFVVTSRAREYAELRPKPAGRDCQVALLGLTPQQVSAVLDKQTSGRPEWNAVRHQVATKRSLAQLLQSPLRLAIAVRTYREPQGDPRELFTLNRHDAEAHLWDRLLSGTTGFGRADSADVIKWLRFLATAMKQQGRQRLWLHELYLFAPTDFDYERRFAIGIRLTVGLIIALIAGLTFTLTAGLDHGVVAGALMGLVASSSIGLTSGLEPSLRMMLPWRIRVRSLRLTNLPTLTALLVGVPPGLLLGLTLAWTEGLAIGLGVGFAIWLVIALVGAVAVGSELAAAPGRLAVRGPNAVLTATRNHALAAGLAAGLAPGLGFGLTAGPHVGLPAGLLVGLRFSLFFGLFAWLYHHWLRRRLARQGLLPRRLRRFMNCCAKPEQGWLRVSDAYEFRHRELLDHLAPSAHHKPEPRPSTSPDSATWTRDKRRLSASLFSPRGDDDLSRAFRRQAILVLALACVVVVVDRFIR